MNALQQKPHYFYSNRKMVAVDSLPNVCNIVVRDYELMQAINELRHVLNDTAVNVLDYNQQYLNLPVIDLDAMLEYVCSDLDKVVKGEIDSKTLAYQYVLIEVIDHDIEMTPLIEGVIDLVARILQVCVNHIHQYNFDHYVQHKYDLQRILPSGGVMLRRVDQSAGDIQRYGADQAFARVGA